MVFVRALDPGGVLERLITIDGTEQPLWRSLYEASADEYIPHYVRPRLLARYGLSLVERIEVAIDIARRAYGLYGVDLVPFDEIAPDDAVARWAPLHADRLQREAQAMGAPPNAGATAPLVLALLRNGIALDVRWDLLLPVHAPPRVLVEIWSAVPAERRETVLYERLCGAYNVVAYPTAALLARELGSRACARYLTEHVDALDHPPRVEVKRIIEAIEPALAAGIETLSLEIRSAFKPRSVDELSPIARAQLLAAMARYDGKDLSLEARLSDADEDESGSVASSLERIELAGDRTIEGYLYMSDSGTFFAGGTTEVVAEIIQCSLHCDDPVLEAALRAALGWG